MESQKTATTENSVQSNSSVTAQDARSLSQELPENEQTVDLVQESMKGSNEGGMDRNGWQGSEGDESRVAGTAALAMMLGQLVGYFSGKADADDLDVLSFSLHHLFCRLDLLFRGALPALMQLPKPDERPIETSPAACPRQQYWKQLHIINRALDRMEPLCQLLSDATECILDAFDSSISVILATGAEQPQTPSLQAAPVGTAPGACPRATRRQGRRAERAGTRRCPYSLYLIANRETME